jgi:deoxyribose-phosphate aldolase
VTACKLSEAAGADWVKTSTGFAPGGATISDLRLMRANVSEKVQVKAAGGIRTLPALLEAIDTGITRCGATATATILDDFKAQRPAGSLNPGLIPRPVPIKDTPVEDSPPYQTDQR